MRTTTADRAAPDRAPQIRPERRAPAGLPGALLTLQQSAGNAAVGGVVRTLQRAPKPIDMRLTAAPGDAVVFETPKARLSDIEVHFTGRLSVKGKATLADEEAPAKGQRAWANTRVRDLAKATLEAQAPTGTDRHIELVIGGETLVLDLAQGLTGLPPFAVSGRFRGERNLTFGSASVAGPNAKKNAAVGLDATAWITPAASKPGVAPAAAAGDAAVGAFTWGGDQARFEDTHKVKGGKEIERSGTLALWDSIKQIERDFPAFVKGHKFLALPEQRVAFLQEMRAYFGDDAKTIAHFKRLRKVKRGEQGDGADPPRRGGHAAGGGARRAARRHDAQHGHRLAARHAVAARPGGPLQPPRPRLRRRLQRDRDAEPDGRAPEGPDPARDRRAGLAERRVEGGRVRGGAKHTEQRAPMADPDPKSELGKQLAKVESEAKG